MSRILEVTASKAKQWVAGVDQREPPAASTGDFAERGPQAPATRHEQAAAQFVYLGDHDAVLASASVWTHDTPVVDGNRVGVIGQYTALDAFAAGKLLEHCCRYLAEHGCALAVGPMDGNTWRPYRLVTSRGNEPPFFLEPDNPDDYPQHFASAGFFELAHYVSTLNTDLKTTVPHLGELEGRFARLGVRIRDVDLLQLARDLDRIYGVSQAAFAASFLYTPIDREAFKELYKPVCAVLEPSLVLLAEHEGRPVGFIFGIGDMNQRERGEAMDTLIVKSLAILPDRRYAGLGTVLLCRCQDAARRLGFRRAIHALMHEDNDRVGRLSARYGRPFRRYTLFAKRLT